MQVLAKILIAPLIFVLSLAGYTIKHTSDPVQNLPVIESQQSVTEENSLGAQNAVAGEVYYLSGSGISATQNTIDLTKFGYTNPDKTYQKFTMINFGDLGCATIQPSTVGKQEFVSWTGVTQNTDGTAQLTGVTRGLERFSPYSASTTLQTNHPGGSQLVISNSPPCFYQNYATLKNNQTFSGISTFTDPPIFSNVGTSTAQAASIGYVNSVSAAGAATSTNSVSGIGFLATGIQAAQGTHSTVSPRFLSTAISTSSPDIQHPNMIPVTNATGVLNPNFIATSSTDAPRGYLYTATILSQASTTLAGPSTLASTTIQSALINNIVSIPVLDKILATSTDININTNQATTTILTFPVPAGTLGTNSGFAGKFRISNLKLSQNNAVTFEGLYGGSAIFDISTTTTGVGSGWQGGLGEFDFVIQGNGSTSVQEGDASISTFIFQNTAAAGNSVLPLFFIKTATGATAINSNIDQTFSLVIRFNAGDAESGITVTDAQVWSIK